MKPLLFLAYVLALMFVFLFIVANVVDLMRMADGMWATVDYRCQQ